MREYWANVYVWRRGEEVGSTASISESGPDGAHGAASSRFRVHVRLKPEGAPKRYESEANRRAWESDAKACRKTMRTFRVSAESIHPDD